MKILFLILHFLFPRFCVLCGCSLIGIDEIRYSLCKKCRLGITFISGIKCKLCGKPLVSEKDYCLACRNGGEKFYDHLWVLFPYSGKYQKLLAAYKFGKNIKLAEFFAEKILEVILSNPVLNDAVIVPVPPRPGKIKSAGWDQVDYLVRKFKQKNRDRLVSFCLKRKESKVQKRLNRTERMDNLKGRIFINGVIPKTVLIIDDVITTGSTMEVCSSVLKEAGAEKVYGLCLFYD